MKQRGLILALFLVFAFAHSAAAQTTLDRTADLLFKIAVYGPSDDIFIWWGHTALLVKNTRWGFTRAFDWGLFSYPSDNFLLDFIKGRVTYRSGVGLLFESDFIEEDRDMVFFTLNLDAAGREAVLNFAEEMTLPENRYYDYHEFLDNCATRIRDIINLGTGGQFKEHFSNTPGRFTYRQHVRRFTSLRPLADLGFDFIMGLDLDRPISAWEEMFLPVEIGRNISDFSFIDSYGNERALVKSVEIRNASLNRQPVLNKPLTVWPLHLVFGLILAFALLFVKKMRVKFPLAGRIVWGVSQSILGLILGIAGCALFFMLFILHNSFTEQNINILFINPLLLAALPLGILAAIGKVRCLQPERALRILWAYVFIAGFFTIIAGLIPAFNQQNQSTLALILPAALVLAQPEKFLRR